MKKNKRRERGAVSAIGLAACAFILASPAFAGSDGGSNDCLNLQQLMQEAFAPGSRVSTKTVDITGLEKLPATYANMIASTSQLENYAPGGADFWNQGMKSVVQDGNRSFTSTFKFTDYGLGLGKPETSTITTTAVIDHCDKNSISYHDKPVGMGGMLPPSSQTVDYKVERISSHSLKFITPISTICFSANGLLTDSKDLATSTIVMSWSKGSAPVEPQESPHLEIEVANTALRNAENPNDQGSCPSTGIAGNIHKTGGTVTGSISDDNYYGQGYPGKVENASDQLTHSNQ